MSTPSVAQLVADLAAERARADAAEVEVARLRRERDHAMRSLIRERLGVAAPMERRRRWATP